MATAEAEREHHNEILQCSICIDVFKDPRTLPCLHNFCLMCIVGWSKGNLPGSEVACPECRQKFVIPASGIDGLQKNCFLGNLVSRNEMKRKANRMCEVCPGPKKKTAQVFCLQCEQSYCNACGRSHSKMKISSSHELVSLDDLRNDVEVNWNKRPTYCDIHKDELVKVFCLEDKVAICWRCSALDHRSHHCEEITKIADEFRIGKLKKELQAAKSCFDDEIGVLNHRKLSFSDQTKNVASEICKEADRRIKMFQTQVETEKQNLITELHEIKINYEQEITNLAHEFSQAKSLVTRFANYCDQLMKNGSDVDICRESANLSRRTDELVTMKNLENTSKKLNVTTVVFSPPSVTVDNTETILGHVRAVIETCPTVAHTLQFDGKQFITAMALWKNKLFVICQKMNDVAVYDSSTLKLKRTFKVPRLVEPIAAAICPFNKLLFITCYENNRVHRVNLSTKKITSWTVDEDILGISVNSDHDLIVTCSYKIQKYTPNGLLLQELSNYMDCWHAVEINYGDSLMVSCSHGSKHCIKELTWEGEVLCSYGNLSGSGRGQLDFPEQFVISSNGSVLVADSGNDRIQILDSKLKTARTLPLPVNIDFKKPLALCYDESRGRLYVGEGGGFHSLEDHFRLLVFDDVINL